MSNQPTTQMSRQSLTESNHRFDVVVIGGGQAGLATGYHLARRGIDFVILESNSRVGDNWRNRWDSLRLFTPARYNGLPGTKFPAPGHTFPTRDEMADFLEQYANDAGLPVRTNTSVQNLVPVNGAGNGFLVDIGGEQFTAGQVVIATGPYLHPRVPEFAGQLDPKITQLHSAQYRNPAQLSDGEVLIAGASNSGAEIALDVSGKHHTILSGRDTGSIPFRVDSLPARYLVRPLWLMANHVLTINTPMGRKMKPLVRSHGGPLVRVKPSDLEAAGVERVTERVTGVQNGKPALESGRVLDVANLVWCTGFRKDFGWIELPIIGEDGYPEERRGVVSSAPGLYFVGLPFQRSFSSMLIGGVARDAKYVVGQIASTVSRIS